MSARRLALAILCLAPACGAEPPIPGTEPSLRVTLGTDAVEPGRGFPLTVVRTWTKDLVATAWDDRALAPLVVRLEGTRRREDDRRVEETRRYRGYAFSLGDVAVPPPSFSVRPKDGGPARTVSASAIRLRVKPTLDPAAPGAPEPPGDPLSEPFPWRPLALGGALALAALGGLLVRARRRRPVPGPVPAGEPTPRVGAEERALERLGRIRARSSADAGARRADVADAADVVREWLEERFGVAAPRMSTEESSAAAGTVAPLGTEGPARLRGVLLRGDRAKFAGETPTAPEREDLLDRAESLVRGADAAPGSGTP